jgi:hypothetical protein
MNLIHIEGRFVMVKILILLTAFCTLQANAIPLRFKDAPNFDLTISYNFNGIAKTKNCSASVVRFRNDDENAKAKLLTNGHCTGMGSRVEMGSKMPAPGEVLVNQRSRIMVEFLSDDGKKSAGIALAELLVYGTMTDTDMAIFLLDMTYKKLKERYGVNALVLSDKPVPAGTPIQIVSGYWRIGYSCNLDGYVYRLKESDWTFKDSIRYSEEGCKVIGGTSGSPILSANTREVVGVNNTVNDDGEECTLNNPCEQSRDGRITIYTKGGYGQHTDWLYTCLNGNNQIDLSVNGCQLPKPQ